MRQEYIPVVIVERDVDDPFCSRGCLIWEQRTDVSHEDALEHAVSLARGGKYGRVWMGELIKKDLEEIGPGGRENVLLPTEEQLAIERHTERIDRLVILCREKGIPEALIEATRSCGNTVDHDEDMRLGQ